MSERICKNCRWWEGGRGVPCVPPGGLNQKFVWGECVLAEDRDINIGKTEYESPKHREKHYCWNGLTTREDFGCVQWEGKE